MRASSGTFLCGYWEGSYTKALPEAVDRFVICSFVSFRTVDGSVKAPFDIVRLDRNEGLLASSSFLVTAA